MQIKQEVQKRKTFAIISHPDAGKTTMTEKLLVFGNLIRTAGTVKGKKSGNSPHPTGWKSKSSVEFPLHHL